MTALVCDKKQGLTCEQEQVQGHGLQGKKRNVFRSTWLEVKVKTVILVLAAFHSLVFRPIVRKL